MTAAELTCAVDADGALVDASPPTGALAVPASGHGIRPDRERMLTTA